MEKVQLILQLLHPYTFIPTSTVIREMRVALLSSLSSWKLIQKKPSKRLQRLEGQGLTPIGSRSKIKWYKHTKIRKVALNRPIKFWQAMIKCSDLCLSYLITTVLWLYFLYTYLLLLANGLATAVQIAHN